MWVDKRSNWHVVNHAYRNDQWYNCSTRLAGIQPRVHTPFRLPTLISRPQPPHNPGFLAVIFCRVPPGMRSIHPHKCQEVLSSFASIAQTSPHTILPCQKLNSHCPEQNSFWAV